MEQEYAEIDTEEEKEKGVAVVLVFATDDRNLPIRAKGSDTARSWILLIAPPTRYHSPEPLPQMKREPEVLLLQ